MKGRQNDLESCAMESVPQERRQTLGYQKCRTLPGALREGRRRERGRHADRQTEIETETQTERDRHRETDRQADRQR